MRTRNNKMTHVTAPGVVTTTLLTGVPGLRIAVVGYRVMQADGFGWFADAIAPAGAVGTTQVATSGANSTGMTAPGDGSVLWRLPPGRSMVYNNTFAIQQSEVHFLWHWESN